MYNKMHKNKIIFVVLIVLFTVVFKSGCNSDFQYDSEDLAIGSLAAGHYNIDADWYGLGRLNYKIPEKGFVSEKIYKGNYNDINNLQFIPYSSQLGLQGKIYKAVGGLIYHKELPGLFRWINCFLLASVIVSILVLIEEKYNTLLSCVWGITFLLSPWILNFAPNLYWVEFTWFLPMLIGLLAISDKLSFAHKDKVLYLSAFLSIAIKSLCGYEYLSTIMMSMIMFILTDLFTSILKKNEEEYRRLAKLLIRISLSGLLGFVCAIGIHGFYRGNGDVFLGLNEIYFHDVLRRTALGTVSNFKTDNTLVLESINIPVYKVVWKYLNYQTNPFHFSVLVGFSRKFFLVITVGAFWSIYKRLRDDQCNYQVNIRYASLLFLSLLSTLSWIILAKSHSYIHTHMNYVLWYFGYVQMCLFIIIDSAVKYFNNYSRGKRNA